MRQVTKGTGYQGLRKVEHYLTLLFTCVNLKKFALWKRKQKTKQPTPKPSIAAVAFASCFYRASKNGIPDFLLDAIFSTVCSIGKPMLFVLNPL